MYYTAQGRAGQSQKPYKSEYARLIIEYFAKDAAREGNARLELPSLVGFARLCGVSVRTLNKWAEEKEEFCEAVKEASIYRRQHIIDGVISGGITPSAAKLLLDIDDEDGRENERPGEAESFGITITYSDSV